MNRETILQNRILAALCEQGCYAENHTVGRFYTSNGTVVRVGTRGQADIYGHRWDGLAFYIEVKLPGENPRPDQQRFLDAMRAGGAISGCAHSVEEALAIVFGENRHAGL